ncbi:hypothetical protein B0J13DRAFT_250040 [Dactylonectria estremocensis]|uniref:N-acetyltransferase domain-containing protein n=1 Tax=Dactylonectria estremocensis TaxID=1079267 RepID=A0A9P9J734_9HYPO|nr:hypothetical protein B0J13DRAFT_250040 [Dactylonectria estremocensis]
MAFDIVVPSGDDALEMASTHLAAMDANLLMHAQFPNAESREFLRDWLRKDTLDHIADNDKGVLIARNTDTGEIASFVKWNVQRQRRSGDKDGGEHEEEIPECCRREYLDSYAELTKKARRNVLGDGAHYHVTYLCTHPEWSGRGAASGLLRSVLDKAAAADVPAVLEATMNAVTFYERLGFEIRQELTMMLPPRGSSEPTEHYAERTMVWMQPPRP